jgi:hypothetical protein
MIRHPVLLYALCLGLVPPAAGQTVIYPDPPPQRPDSTRPQTAGSAQGTSSDTARRDTTRVTPAPFGISPAPAKPPAAPAPPPAAAPAAPPSLPPADPVVTRACTDAAPGESAPDLLAIVFASGAAPGTDDVALAAVGGKRLGGSAGDRYQYMQVPAAGSEFRLRALADKLIRLSGVSEVGPVTCPEVPPAAPPAPRADSASS